MSDLIRLTGLWVNKGESGKFMSGQQGGAVYFVFSNTKKEKENDPDYYLCIGKPKKKEGDKGKEDNEDELPF